MKLYGLSGVFFLLAFMATSACLTTGSTCGNVKKQPNIIINRDIPKIENQNRVYTVDLVLYEKEGREKKYITLSPPQPETVSP